MEEKRESVICVKGSEFKEADVRFGITFKMDFGKNECLENMAKISALGIAPSECAVAIVHEFDTEDGAKKFVEKLGELKEMIPPLSMMELTKAEGKKVIISVRLPPNLVDTVQILGAVADSMGDFASQHQFLEFKILISKAMKDFLHCTEGTPLSSALEALCLKLTLDTKKELPIKIAEFFKSLTGSTDPSIDMVGNAVAAFHHLKLDVELRKPTEFLKSAFKDPIAGALMEIASRLYGMGTDMGFIDIVKQGGVKTVAYLCLAPILSFEFTLLAPTAVESIEKFIPS